MLDVNNMGKTVVVVRGRVCVTVQGFALCHSQWFSLSASAESAFVCPHCYPEEAGDLVAEAQLWFGARVLLPPPPPVIYATQKYQMNTAPMHTVGGSMVGIVRPNVPAIDISSH